MTQDEMRRLFDYDAATGALIWKHRGDAPKQWNVRYAGKVAGRVCERGYVKVRLNGRQYYAHRLVWAWHGKDGSARCLDHINRCKADNRVENLRAATHSQNLANWDRGGRRGVSFSSRVGKFAAQIVCKGKHHWLGYFDTEQDAKAAYKKAANDLFGEFACSA